MQASTSNWFTSAIGWPFQIITIVLLFYFNVFRNRKALAYTVISNPVASSTAGLPGNIVILYDAGGLNPETVNNVYTTLISIRNSGRKEIGPEDFMAPLTFKMPGSAKILNAMIGDCKPEHIARHINFAVSSTKDAITIEPILLNSGDKISFSLVLSGVSSHHTLSTDIACDTRIKGISRVTLDLDDTTRPNRLVFRWMMVFFSVLMVDAAGQGLSFSFASTQIHGFICFGAAIAIYLWLLWGALYPKR